jgi:spore coat polysaccharide biosynthesis protein SpsF
LKTIIFIQARENSTRLPGKVLKKLCGKSIIQIIFERMKKIHKIHKIILITGPQSINNNLTSESKKIGLDYFCGSESNLLDRFYHASKFFEADNIIRITADNPFSDINLINHAIDIFENGNYQILSNNRIRTYPIGLNFEIFTSESLKLAWNDEKKNFRNTNFSDLIMSPTKYMLYSGKFINYDLVNNENLSKIRLTIDTLDDFNNATKYFNKIYPNNPFFNLKDIIKYIDMESKGDKIK